MWLALLTLYATGVMPLILWTNAEVFWPSGTYGLPKPKGECPVSDDVRWSSGWRKQDMEDETDGKFTAISTGSHMDAEVLPPRNDLTRSFCVKTKSGTSKRDWPKGSYCIYKKGDCPRGMEKGSVRWDDENYSNDNGKKGTLPDGSYDENTIIWYCCQKQGVWSNAIELPVDSPFYLLPRNTGSSPHCQVVKWALSSVEYIIYDTNDQSNGDRYTGSHVFFKEHSGDSAPQIFYCYYEGCRYIYTTDVESGLLNAPAPHLGNGYPQYQYCSWLITVDTTRIVKLSFNKLSDFQCDKSFIKIYDGRNGTAPVLTTICGTNVMSGTRIFSTSNNIFMVLNAGDYPRSLHPQFDARYDSSPKIENNFISHSHNGFFEWSSPNGPVIGFPRRFFWSVMVKETFVVLLKFTNLSISSCRDSYLRVYDGKTNASSLLTTLCGSNATSGTLVISSSNHVVMELNTGRYLRKPSNSLKLVVNYSSQALERNQKYTADDGSFEWRSPPSPIHGYPNKFSWLLTVKKKCVLMLNVSIQFLASACNEKYVIFYDGNNDTAPILMILCGRNATSNTSIVYSSTNAVYVTLKTNKYVPHVRFMVTYSAQPPQDTGTPSDVKSSETPVMYIVIAVVLSVFLLIVLAVIILFRKRRRKRQGTEQRLVRGANPSYEQRMSTVPTRTSPVNDYEAPNSPQEKIWVGNSTVCKESRNPIYQPATDEADTYDAYSSADNITYEPAVDNSNPDYAIPQGVSTPVYDVPTATKDEEHTYYNPT